MFDWIFSPEAWLSLVTLTGLEIVLGIDNIIFIAILVGKLPPEQQAQANSEAGAIALMMAQPSVIKRPVLVCGGKITVGFDADAYAALFQAAS